jgi:hypothetical protein
MDAENDGFPGLVASEISGDAEAAALVEQFSMTVRMLPCRSWALRQLAPGSLHSHPDLCVCLQTGMQLDVPQSSIQVNGITAGRRRMMVEDGVLQEKMQLRIDYVTL